MGQGVFQALPLALSGVARILDLMDWGDAEAFILGAPPIGARRPEDEDYRILIAPAEHRGSP